MEEVDFSTILSYHTIKVGDMFILRGAVQQDEHTHTFVITEKAAKVASLKIKICKCYQNDPTCVLGNDFTVTFDQLRSMKGKYINTEMGKILYGG